MALPRGAAWTTTSTWFAFFTLRRQDAKSFACEFGESRGLTVRYAAKYGMALQEQLPLGCVAEKRKAGNGATRQA